MSETLTLAGPLVLVADASNEVHELVTGLWPSGAPGTVRVRRNAETFEWAPVPGPRTDIFMRHGAIPLVRSRLDTFPWTQRFEALDARWIAEGAATDWQVVTASIHNVGTMERSDISNLQLLPDAQARVQKELDPWSEYLELAREDLANKRLWFSYQDMRRCGTDLLVRCSDAVEVPEGTRLQFMSDGKGRGDNGADLGDCVGVRSQDGAVWLRVGPIKENGACDAIERFPSAGTVASSIVRELRVLTAQKTAVNDFRTGAVANPDMPLALLDPQSSGLTRRIPVLEVPPWRNERLNPAQKDAVVGALSTRGVYALMGPPGTGKTSVIREVVQQAVRDGRSVLVTSQTHAAINVVLSELPEDVALRILRRGRAEKLGDATRFAPDQAATTWLSWLQSDLRTRVAADAWAAKCDDLKRQCEAARPHQARSESALREATTNRQKLIRERELLETSARTLAALGEGVRGGCELPSMAQVGNPAIKNVIAGIPVAPGALASTPGWGALQDGLRLAAHRAALLAAVVAVDAALGGACPLGDETTRAELADLRRQHARLVCGTSAEAMHELMRVNRRLQELADDGWTRSTRVLGLCLADALGGVPQALKSLVAALLPGDVPSVSHRALQTMRNSLERDLPEWLASVVHLVNGAIADERAPIQSKLDGLDALELASQHRLADAKQVRAKATARLDAAEARLKTHQENPPTLQSDEPSPRPDRWTPLRRELLARLDARDSEADAVIATAFARATNVRAMTLYECSKLSLADDAVDLVIIDEVSKATVPELLIAARLGRSVLLVGDHRQLPPILVDGASPELVRPSLFERLHHGSTERCRAMLKEQYRMAPPIMRTVNQFYEGRLLAGEPVRDRTHGLRVPDAIGGLLLDATQNLLWIDTSADHHGQQNHEQQSGTSKENLVEQQVVTELLRKLDVASRDGEPLSVAVISMYGAQTRALRTQLCGMSLGALDVGRSSTRTPSAALLRCWRRTAQLPSG